MPLIDLVGVPAVQAKLLHSLATLYGQNWDRRMVAEFLGLLGAGIGVGYVARLLGREAIKLVPGWGQTLGAMWGATAGSVTTYALGKSAAYYFARLKQGGSVDSAALRRIYAEALNSGADLLKTPSGTPQP